MFPYLLANIFDYQNICFTSFYYMATLLVYTQRKSRKGSPAATKH